MQRFAALIVTTTLSATLAHAQEHRELGAHVHGESALNIAIEGNTVSMELEAPAMDIVGFEHEASTDEQKAALAGATEALADPLAIFVMPSGAGCTVTEASVEHRFEEHEHAEGEAHDEEAKASEGHAEDEHAAEAEHSEFEAAYQLTCTDPTAITGIDFRFFERFPNAERVDVQIVSAGGQSSFEVERGAPHLGLSGSM